ncbi:MAG: hypothetical protein R3211_01000, partial [Balneolaceae bacterium]|nr:hypothetical protein [Balneolaceae bacterium]
MPILRHSAVPCSVFDISLPDDGIGTQQLVFVSGIEVSGTRQIPVVPEEELEIMVELPDTTSVWPTIPNGGAHPDFDFTQVENTKEEIVVTVTEKETPVEGQPVTITVEWEAGSGGHDHDGGNDIELPPLNRRGWLVDLAEGDSARGQLQAVTDPLGEIRLRYRAGQFGGEIEFRAETVSNGDTLSATSDSLIITVPGLVRLEDGDHY